VSKNIYLKNNIGRSYFNKNTYAKDKIKVREIINNIFFSLNKEKNSFYSLSEKFNFNHSKFIKFNKYKSIILIGMGGSALGAQALYSFFKDKIKKKFFF
tara:strand:- start:1477 stop:1773 length:297 start_codon:yes stop_codon:yes gene_type:complete